MDKNGDGALDVDELHEAGTAAEASTSLSEFRARKIIEIRAVGALQSSQGLLGYAQRAQKPFLKDYTFNHIRDLSSHLKHNSLLKGDWAPRGLAERCEPAASPRPTT